MSNCLHVLGTSVRSALAGDRSGEPGSRRYLPMLASAWWPKCKRLGCSTSLVVSLPRQRHCRYGQDNEQDEIFEVAKPRRRWVANREKGVSGICFAPDAFNDGSYQVRRYARVLRPVNTDIVLHHLLDRGEGNTA